MTMYHLNILMEYPQAPDNTFMKCPVTLTTLHFLQGAGLSISPCFYAPYSK